MTFYAIENGQAGRSIQVKVVDGARLYSVDGGEFVTAQEALARYGKRNG